MNIFGDERLFALGIINGTTARGAGNMREYKNQDAVFASLGISAQNMLRFKQVHGTKIVTVDNEADFNCYSQNLVEADGWLISRADTGAVILTADCVPLYMWDEGAQNIALIHAGWRGVAAGMPAMLARTLKERGGKTLYAFTGPHIQSCCFEVQEDVASKFSPGAVERRGDKTYVNLRTEIRLQLAAEGVMQENIHTPCACTCHNEGDYFSYRRDHAPDCIMSFVYKIK